MSDNKHRMYADFSEEAYEAYQKGDAIFNNGFRDKKGNYHADQPDFSEIDDEDEDSEASDGLDPESVGIGLLIGAAIAGIGYVYSRRHDIKAWFTDKAIPGVKQKWYKITKKEYVSKATVAELPLKFSTEVDTALNEYEADSNNEDAQRKLLEIMELAALLAKKIREFSGAVTKDEAFIETKDAIEKLTTQKTTDYINAILEKNPDFLDANNDSTLYKLYKNQNHDKEYVPIQNSKIQEMLSID